MRVLFTSQPNPTHAAMLLPCARALRDAGHQVRFATPASLAARLEKQGFDAIAAGFDWAAIGPAKAFPGIEEEWTPTNFSFDDAFAGPTAEKIIPDLLALGAEWKPDIIIREHMEFGGYLAAEILGIPHATCGINPNTALEHFRRWASPWLDAHRRAYNLDADPELANPYRYLDISHMPPSWRRTVDTRSEVTRAFNSSSINEPSSKVLPEWINDLPRRPLVHVTFGTTVWDVEMYQSIIRPLGNEPLNVVVACGPIDPAALAPTHPNTRVERFFSHDALLPRCDLLVMHGGANTTLAALTLGMPILVVPKYGDQHRMAATIVEMGVGKTLSAKGPSPEDVRGAVRELLEVPSFRRRAEELRDEIGGLPPILSAVDLVAELARTKMPVC